MLYTGQAYHVPHQHVTFNLLWTFRPETHIINPFAAGEFEGESVKGTRRKSIIGCLPKSFRWAFQCTLRRNSSLYCISSSKPVVQLYKDSSLTWRHNHTHSIIRLRRIVFKLCQVKLCFRLVWCMLPCSFSISLNDLYCECVMWGELFLLRVCSNGIAGRLSTGACKTLKFWCNYFTFNSF